MKKKAKPRDIRETKKLEKSAAYSTKVAKTVPEAVEKSVEVVASESAANNVRKKSRNKAAGLKSTLVCADKLFMTSFGNGNTAVVEHKIDTNDYVFSSIADNPSLMLNSADELALSFSSKRPFVKDAKLSAINPLHSGVDKPVKSVGQDMLGLKDKLEMRYFGKTFDDNLHIQIIYNILDIEKIIAVYATNITAAIDHMIDEEIDTDKEDFIGYMGTRNPYDVFMDPMKDGSLKPKDRINIGCSRDKFEKLLNTKRLGYFGFEYDSKSKDKGKAEETKKRLYHLMAFAGQLRQWSFHSAGNYPRAWLYKLEDTKLPQEYRDTLDHYFNARFDEINNKFVEQNSVNLCILRELFPGEDFKAVADMYYDFIVIKSQKNMGFSIKKLREKMLELEEAAKIKSQEMDSVRSKLYKLIDFCIFKYYKEHSALCKNNVDRLRASVSEEQKDAFYTEEANSLWNLFSKQFLSFCDNMPVWVKSGDYKKITDYIDKDAYRKSSNVSYFSKLLFAMCFFLDGKEINDLLTTLINKFDNIASFIKTAKDLAMDVPFISDYNFFNNSGKYVSELNIVKNISRMKKPSENAKLRMYRDALTILGVPADMSGEKFDEELEKILKKEKDPKTGKQIKGKNSFRNFIANNVIENTRFIYVIKFCNPANIRRLVNNTKLTEFVLKRMPVPQIDRYYASCKGPDLNPPTDKKITALADMMEKMDFSKFSSVKMKVREGSRDAVQKERFKAIISLYLTVVYLIVKNLVNVNARYVMAFHCLERDSILYGASVVDRSAGTDYLRLVTKLYEATGESARNRYLSRNKRTREWIKQDIENAREINMATWYRNLIAHLGAVRRCDEFISNISKIDSYFALYHYLIQKQLEKWISSSKRSSGKTAAYLDSLDRWNTYVKDMVKALNTPFGYNIPRFKNLSIDDLFDRNEVKPLTEEGTCPPIDK